LSLFSIESKQRDGSPVRWNSSVFELIHWIWWAIIGKGSKNLTKTIMASILGLNGSLRRESFNAMLLRAASELAPSGATVEIASIRGIPFSNSNNIAGDQTQSRLDGCTETLEL
jgi:hypothetical protein